MIIIIIIVKSGKLLDLSQRDDTSINKISFFNVCFIDKI